MKRLILRLLGWSIFVYDKVWICQRNCLIDQTIISEVLDATKSRRTWCKDSRLSIYVERRPFIGVYGVEQTVEVARFDGWLFRGKSANIRIAASSLSVSRLTDLIVELNRVSPK